MSEVVSVRLPEGTVARLKLIAWRRSLEQRREVRWTSILKDAIDGVLAQERARDPREAGA
jgi:hypothetical protein